MPRTRNFFFFFFKVYDDNNNALASRPKLARRQPRAGTERELQGQAPKAPPLGHTMINNILQSSYGKKRS